MGYFDDGVFGNLGWGGAGGPEPLGASGIARFSHNGELMWEFKPPGGFGHPAGCYALTTLEEDAWACYYTDFPIDRVRGDSVTGWVNPIAGAHQILATTDGTVGLVGNYDRRDTLSILDLSPDLARSGEATEVARYPLRLPDGSALNGSELTASAGASLHVVADSHWYSTDIGDINPRT